MASTLERLPPEILQGISEILDIAHPRSLLAFASASKGCYAIACPFLFRTVKVAIGDGKQPLQDVRVLEIRLLRDDSFAHVRRIILYFNPNRPYYPYLSLDRSEKGREDDTELWSCWDHCQSDSPSRKDFTRRAAANWSSVARLMEQLTGLTDLFWVCPEQLPPCILEVLHKKVRYCRLHHYTFELSSPSQMSLSSHERDIITSPCLYSVGNLLAKSPDAIPPSARSPQSPSLRRVYLPIDLGTIGLSDDAADGPQSVPYELIQLEDSSRSDSISFDLLRKETCDDFSALRVLKLYEALATQNLPPPSNFPSLVTLAFTCHSDIPPHYWDEVTTLLRNLPRLTSLQLRDWDATIPVTPALSPNLRKLDLSTSRAPNGSHLYDDRMYQLAEICPNLEYLEIEINRSRGNAAEVARYRALGRLPRLQELHLTVDPSPPDFVQIPTDGGHTSHTDTVVEPWFDEQDAQYLRGKLRPYRQGHASDVLVNNAIDATLARSIFEVIDGAKPRSPCRPSPLPLEHLSLYIYEDGSREMPQLYDFISVFHNRWEIERDVRDDAREVLHVKNADSRAKSKERIKRLKRAKANQYLFGLWRRVWPVENEGVDWWDDWKSRPLDLALEVGETEISG